MPLSLRSLTHRFKTYKKVSMLEYKRNQVEQAIAGVLEPKSLEAAPELKTRMKRLLDADRALGRAKRASSVEETNYAFYSGNPPGSGVEVWFSSYEAFALLNGLRLMEHGWPQGLAVSILRRVRNDLESEHTRILKLDVRTLFDEKAIKRAAKEGDFAFDNSAPAFLAIVSKSCLGPIAERAVLDYRVCEGTSETMKWISKTTKGSYGFSMFELVSVAHALKNKLAQTEPRHRGRGA
jgi:hypothetical protein